MPTIGSAFINEGVQGSVANEELLCGWALHLSGTERGGPFMANNILEADVTGEFFNRESLGMRGRDLNLVGIRCLVDLFLFFFVFNEN